MLVSSLATRRGLNGRISDDLLPAYGAGPSTDSKGKLESPEVFGRLLKQSPTLSV